MRGRYGRPCWACRRGLRHAEGEGGAREEGRGGVIRLEGGLEGWGWACRTVLLGQNGVGRAVDEGLHLGGPAIPKQCVFWGLDACIRCPCGHASVVHVACMQGFESFAAQNKVVSAASSVQGASTSGAVRLESAVGCDGPHRLITEMQTNQDERHSNLGCRLYVLLQSYHIEVNQRWMSEIKCVAPFCEFQSHAFDV